MLDFNVVKKRESITVEEKYDFPVLAIHKEAQPEEGVQRAVQKFELNKAAAKLLNLQDGINYVGLAYMPVEDSKELVIVNFKGETKWKMAKFNKDFSFNSKQMFNILHKELEFDKTEANEFAVSHHIDEESGFEFLTLDYNLLDREIPQERLNFNEDIEYAEVLSEEDALVSEAEALDEMGV